MELNIPPFVIAVLVLWELAWTGVACWHAARKNDKHWYIFFCLITVLGLPEIIYVLTQKKTDPPA